MRRYNPRRIYMGRVALVVIAVICAPILTAQQPAPADTLSAFEVASIRPSDAGQRYALRFQQDASMSVTSAVVERLILMAYALHDAQLANKPKWVEEERFDIHARNPAGASAANPDMLRSATPAGGARPGRVSLGSKRLNGRAL